MNEFPDPAIWAKILLILAVAALIITGLATLTAPSCDPVTKPAPVTSEAWCRILHDTGSSLSCDWDDPDLPAKAFTEYQSTPGTTAEQATINAAQEQR